MFNSAIHIFILTFILVQLELKRNESKTEKKSNHRKRMMEASFSHILFLFFSVLSCV